MGRRADFVIDKATDWLPVIMYALPFLLVAQVVIAQQDTRTATELAQEALAENQSENRKELGRAREDLAASDAKIDALIEQVRLLGAEPVVQPRPTTTTTVAPRNNPNPPPPPTTSTTAPPTTTTTQPPPPCTTLPLAGRCL